MDSHGGAAAGANSNEEDVDVSDNDGDEQDNDISNTEDSPLGAAKLLQKRRERDPSGSEVSKRGKRVSSSEENFQRPYAYVRLPYPVHWSDESVDESHLGSYKEVLLRPSTPEYDFVRHSFQSGRFADIGTVRKIYRIESPMRLTIFQLELAAMMEKKGEQALVRRLYHSSKNPYNYHSILKDNFSLKYADKSALGQGIYFAESPLYSNHHAYSSVLNPDFGGSPPDPNVIDLQGELSRTKIMLVCNVILGEVLNLREKNRDTADMTVPAPGYDSHGFREDDNDRIYCVFSNKRILPEYVIYYDVDRDQAVDDVGAMQSRQNLDQTGRPFPMLERTRNMELYTANNNDRELVIEVENTPKSKAYHYGKQRSWLAYDLEVTDREKLNSWNPSQGDATLAIS